MKAEDAKARANILKALGHPARVLIVDELSRRDCCVSDLLPLVKSNQSVLSRHLARLKSAGIVTERKAGLRVIHHLDCPCILQALDCTLGVMKKSVQRQSRLIGKG